MHQAYNVLGTPLLPCSRPGMALTGYTRDGKCTDHKDDTGSHHVCLKMHEAPEDLCKLTKQSDWCSQLQPCQSAPATRCPIQNWCICQWAFDHALTRLQQESKTTDDACKALPIDCHATNREALKAYDHYSQTAPDPSSRVKARNAASCIRRQCGIR